MIETGPKWAPTKKIVSIMEKLKSLMLAPNLDTPMNNEAAADYKNGSWNQKAKQWTQQYAK
jgi:ubiquitin-protein ligase